MKEKHMLPKSNLLTSYRESDYQGNKSAAMFMEKMLELIEQNVSDKATQSQKHT